MRNINDRKMNQTKGWKKEDLEEVQYQNPFQFWKGKKEFKRKVTINGV